MNTEPILNNVSKHIALNVKEKNFFISLLESSLLKRKEIYLSAGEICKHSAFVVDGALKSFTVDVDGKEHILSFATRDWWIALEGKEDGLRSGEWTSMPCGRQRDRYWWEVSMKLPTRFYMSIACLKIQDSWHR